MADGALEERIAEVRRFNRFYTRQIGLLQDGFLESQFSLTDVRVLYELAHRPPAGQITASELGKELGLDAGYLSRILRGFKRHELIESLASEADGRQKLLRLTARGEEVFAPLNQRQRDEIGALLGRLTALEQQRLVGAMGTIAELLGGRPEPRVSYLLRPHHPGDMGWIVQRHGALYAEEYGYDEQFEALVARIVADFLEQFDPKRERCWIAEREGRNVGSIVLVKHAERVAKLRLFLVEPEARGLGIGARLMEECLRFARVAGYEKVTLWTHGHLLAARHIYEKTGFRLVDTTPVHSFGKDLVDETWEVTL